MSRQARQDEMQEAQQEMVEAALAADREASLRDGFAGAALGAIIACEGASDSAVRRKWQAERAYVYADAMMEARKC